MSKDDARRRDAMAELDSKAREFCAATREPEFAALGEALRAAEAAGLAVFAGVKEVSRDYPPYDQLRINVILTIR